MKKLLYLIPVLLLLTACSSKTATNIKETGGIETVSENVFSDFDKCKVKEYKNLDLDNCSIKVPQLKNCGNLHVTIEREPIANKETLRDFEKYVEFFLGEYDSANALFSSPSENVVYNESEDNGKYAWYPHIDNYADQIQNDRMKISSLLYRDINNEKYLWWNNTSDFPHWINKGETYSLIKTDETKISSWIPSDLDKRIASYFNDGSHDDETYCLLDGKVSIGEAIAYFENDYLSSLPYSFDDKFSISVSGVDVYNIQDDLYCYVFNFSTAWNDIPFDSREEAFSYQDNSHEYLISGEALMIRKNDIDTIVDLYFPIVKQEENVIKNICTLENAIDIMSDTLTNNVKFDVNSIEFVYNGEYSEDFKTAYLEPFWKFTTYNPNDTMYYCVYVNAVNGKSSYVSFTPLADL